MLDCQIPPVAEMPPEPKASVDPDLELVTVLETGDRLVVAAAKSLLEDAGIPYCLLGDEIAPRILHLIPRFRVEVGRDHKTEALALIQTLAEPNSSQ
jgi:hypothetical protein